jgi:lipocalin
VREKERDMILLSSSISLSRPVSSQSFSPPAATSTRRSHSSVTVKCCCSSRRLLKNPELKCSLENLFEIQALRKCFVSGFAAILLLSQAGQGIALDLSSGYQNICQLGSAAAVGENKLTLPSDGDSESMMMMMMRGMTAKNFDPVRYSGRWFEVASLKRGFAGQGQEDCHCTQGVYTFDMKESAIRVDTFCVHGSPDGYITGIRGKVQCVGAEDLEKSETDLEKQEMIKEKCFLRFPTIPFIPKLPYDVIATDYDNYALVSGAKDKGFVQVILRERTHEFEKYLLH